jgi:hypothetical protein
MDDLSDALGLLFLFVLFLVVAWAANTFVAYVAIEVVANHDVNFAEAAGVGVLLTSIGTSISATTQASRR